MRIAINTRFLLTNRMEGFGWYTYELCKRLVENHPEHTFIFFFDRPFDKKFLFGENVIPVILSPQARHPILYFLWFEFAISKALIKYKADVFFSPDGYLSLRSKIPQIATIHDLNFEHFPQDLPLKDRLYYRYFFPKFASKAKKILTVSEYSKNDITKTYNIDESKIKAIWNGVADIYKPLLEEEKIEIRNLYAKGKPYFIFVGSLHPRKNIQRLIDAYSHYKENLNSPFDLVIVGKNLFKNKYNINIPENIQGTIHFTGHLSLTDLSKVMGAAACLVFVPYFEGFGIPLVEAMKCGIPIIAGNKTALPEVVGDAALLVDPFNIDDIYQGLCKISSDKNLRNDLAAKALKRSELFSWDITAEKVWKEIVTAVKKFKNIN